MSDGRWAAVGAIAAVASAAVALAAWLWPTENSTNTARPTSGSISRAGGDLPPNMPAPPAFAQEYSAVQFVMSGDGCTFDGGRPVFQPANVIFDAQGPHVYAFEKSPTNNVPLSLVCNDSAKDSVTYLQVAGRVATADGAPDAGACNTAISLRPLAAQLRFVDLRVGMNLCLLPDADKSQLVRLSLISLNSSTYDTTWAATGWSVPAA